MLRGWEYEYWCHRMAELVSDRKSGMKTLRSKTFLDFMENASHHTPRSHWRVLRTSLDGGSLAAQLWLFSSKLFWTTVWLFVKSMRRDDCKICFPFSCWRGINFSENPDSDQIFQETTLGNNSKIKITLFLYLSLVSSAFARLYWVRAYAAMSACASPRLGILEGATSLSFDLSFYCSNQREAKHVLLKGKIKKTFPSITFPSIFDLFKAFNDLLNFLSPNYKKKLIQRIAQWTFWWFAWRRKGKRCIWIFWKFWKLVFLTNLMQWIIFCTAIMKNHEQW